MSAMNRGTSNNRNSRNKSEGYNKKASEAYKTKAVSRPKESASEDYKKTSVDKSGYKASDNNAVKSDNKYAGYLDWSRYNEKSGKPGQKKPLNPDYKKIRKEEYKSEKSDYKNEAKAEFKKEYKSENKAGYRDVSKKTYRDENKKAYSDDNKKNYGEVNKKTYSEENKKNYRDVNKKTYSDENKKTYSDDNKKSYRDENKKTYSDDNKKSYRDVKKKSYSDEKKKSYSDENKKSYRGENNKTYGDDSKKDYREENMKPYRDEAKKDYKEVDKKSYRGENKKVHTTEFKNDKDSDSKKGIESGRKRDQSTHKSAFIPGGCPHIRECGSCNILQKSYEQHLAEKQKMVDTLIKKYCKVEPIIGMKEPKYYRNKVHAVFDHDRKGNPISGVYEEGTHRVIPIEQCLIHNQKADAIINSIRGMLKSFKILTYDEDTGYGLLRHVLVRTGFHSGEIMVVLVLGSPIMPSKNNFVKALRKEHPEITTVVVNVNDKKTSMVLGDKEQVIYGKGYIEDTLCGKVFHISPKSFYQVNPLQTELLYNKAIELAGLNGSETVIDAYCGIGTIGLIASDHAKKVIGVEMNKDAVKDAVINAKRNESTNVEFYKNDAGVFMSQIAEKKDSVDVVFMDPPRTGSNEQFMDALGVLKPEKVVYISCNPVTLERDLQYLTKKGYKAQVAVPVDMFPWTGHVETLVLMSKM